MIPATTLSAVAAYILVTGDLNGIILAGTAKSAFDVFTGEVLDMIKDNMEDDTVEYSFRYKCTEIYEGDPFHPQGGFWFLGYMADARYFSYRIV